PATQEKTTRPPVRKPLLRSDADRGFRILLGGMPLTAQLMEHSSKAQGTTEAKGMGTLLRQRQRFVASCQPLVRIAKQPQRQSSSAMAHHPSVFAVEKRRGAVLLGIVERHPMRKMHVP